MTERTTPFSRLAESAAEPLFPSAHAALTFAFNHSAQVYDRPVMARLAATPQPSSGKGLGGADGAAQAGMILAKLDHMSELHQLIIAARFMSKTTVCPCCTSEVWDADWMAVIRRISDLATLHGVLSGHLVHRSVRDGLVARYFGGKMGRDRFGLGELAVRSGISDRTVTDQNGKITLWLRGSRFAPKGQSAPVIGEEQQAMDSAAASLSAAGLVVG